MARTEEQIYKVHSGVRKVNTRLKRMKAAGRHRFVQRLAGGDIVVRRVRPATITETQLKRHLAELKKARDEGRAVVRTVTGEEVNLDTLKPMSKPKFSAAVTRPKPPLDSASTDKTFPGGVGEHIPIHKDGKALDESVQPPATTQLPGEDVSEEAIRTGGDPVAIRKKKSAKKKRGSR
jgi:hypothetical protein